MKQDWQQWYNWKKVLLKEDIQLGYRSKVKAIC